MTTTDYSLLKPLQLSELLDRAVRLYRQNFFKFIGIVAIFQIPFTALQLVVSIQTLRKLSTWSQDVTAETLDMFAGYPFLELASSFIVGILGFIFIQGLATAVLTRAVADNYLGEQVDILQAYRKIGSTWLRVLGALIVLGLLFIPLLIWTLIPCIGWITGPGIIFYVFIAVSPMVTPVIVLEGRGVGASLRRAWELVRRRFWWVLGFMFILMIFAQLLSSIPNVLVNLGLNFILGDSLDPFTTGPLIQSVSQSIVGLAATLIYMPLQLIAITLAYFDLRVRTEGFDLAMLAQTGKPEGGLTQMTADAPFATTLGPLLTSSEIVRFMAVSGLAVVVYIVFAIIGVAISVASLGALSG